MKEQVLMIQTQRGEKITEEPEFLGDRIGLRLAVSHAGRQLVSVPSLQADDLAWTELTDGDGELDQAGDAAAKAGPDVGALYCDEDILASIEMQHQNIIQLVLATVQSVSCPLVNIDLNHNITLLSRHDEPLTWLNC